MSKSLKKEKKYIFHFVKCVIKMMKKKKKRKKKENVHILNTGLTEIEQWVGYEIMFG